MREHTVKIEPFALEQIREAAAYIRDERGMRQAGSKLIEDLFAAADSLKHMPNRFRRISEEPFFTAGIRRVNVKKYAVLYVVNEDTESVRILGVFYGSPSLSRLRRVLGSETDNPSNA